MLRIIWITMEIITRIVAMVTMHISYLFLESKWTTIIHMGIIKAQSKANSSSSNSNTMNTGKTIIMGMLICRRFSRELVNRNNNSNYHKIFTISSNSSSNSTFQSLNNNNSSNNNNSIFNLININTSNKHQWAIERDNLDRFQIANLAKLSWLLSMRHHSLIGGRTIAER